MLLAVFGVNCEADDCGFAACSGPAPPCGVLFSQDNFAATDVAAGMTVTTRVTVDNLLQLPVQGPLEFRADEPSDMAVFQIATNTCPDPLPADSQCY